MLFIVGFIILINLWQQWKMELTGMTQGKCIGTPMLRYPRGRFTHV